MPEDRIAHREVLRTVRVRARGRVQGVGFRAWTASHAARLGLDGWVRNLRDGSLEAVFSGTPEAVSRMVELACQGPRSSFVRNLEVDEELEVPAAGFSQRPSQ